MIIKKISIYDYLKLPVEERIKHIQSDDINEAEEYIDFIYDIDYANLTSDEIRHMLGSKPMEIVHNDLRQKLQNNK